MKPDPSDVKPFTPYVRMPGRWTPIRIGLILLGIPLTAFVTHLLSLRQAHAPIVVFLAWLTLILWGDVWMYRSQRRSKLFVTVAALWTGVVVLLDLEILLLGIF